MEIQHFGHEHALTLYDMDKDILPCQTCPNPLTGPEYGCENCGFFGQIHCSGCNYTPISGPTYGCTKCYFFLHHSCAALPQHLHHHFHPFHPLTLRLETPDHHEGRPRYTCHVCLKREWFITYRCNECRFNLNVECALSKPSIKFHCLDHLLFLFEYTSFLPKFDPHSETYDGYNPVQFPRHCSTCGVDSSDGLAPIFVCVVPNCDYNVHVHCAPFSLPHKIEHKSHFHSLKFVESLVEDDTDEFYCDACEKKRNPKHPVYYCKECHFIAHIHCAVSEIMPLLITKYEEEAKTQGVSVLDPYLVQLNGEITKLRERKKEVCAKIDAVVAKINTLETELGEYISSLTLSDYKIDA